ncbi:hypothetical protein WEI85_26670 [Actinomycetes bacterium KLBMP 9797]
MEALVFLAVVAAVIAASVGYVAWRDRRGRGQHVDPSVSDDARVQADRQAVQGLLGYSGMPVTDFLPGRPERGR